MPYCPKCGSQVSEESRFCPNCGNDLKAPSTASQAVVAMKPFAGGELLKAGKEVKILAYKTGWKTITMNVP